MSTSFFSSVILLLFVLTCMCEAQQVIKPVDYSISTLVEGKIGDGVKATQVGINLPQGMAIDKRNGNLYYADYSNAQVRYVDVNGISHHVAGSVSYSSSSDINGVVLANSSIGYPIDVALNSKGEVFILDGTYGLILKVFFNETMNANYMTKIAGGFTSPRCIAVSNSNEIYICDTKNYMIRKIVNETIYTIIGTGSKLTSLGNSLDGSPAISSQIGETYGIDFHPETGEMYFTDYSFGLIRYVARNGSLYTYRSNLSTPKGLSFDSNGNIYVIEASYISKIVNGVRSIIAYLGQNSFGGDGGPAIAARFYNPYRILVNDNNLYISDSGNKRIRKIDLNTTIISTVAGDGTPKYFVRSGDSSNISLANPESLYYNSRTDQLLIVDFSLASVYRLNSLTNYTTSSIELIAGTGVDSSLFSYGKLGYETSLNNPMAVVQADNEDIYIASTTAVLKLPSRNNQNISVVAGIDTARKTSGDGYLAIYSKLDSPIGIAISPISGEVYFAESNVYLIRKIDNNGIISTVADVGTSNVRGIAFLPNGNLVMTDYLNTAIKMLNLNNGKITILATLSNSMSFGICTNETDIYVGYNLRILKIDANGATIIAGTGDDVKTQDGTLATNANINPSHGLAINPITLELYFFDALTNAVRRIDKNDGKIYTVVGGGLSYSNQSLANSTYVPTAFLMTFSPNGDLYMTTSDNVIKKLEYGSDIVYTVAGTSIAANSLDGPALSTSLNSPMGVVSTINGQVIFSDYLNKKIRKLQDNTVTTLAGGIGDGGLAINAPIGNVLSLDISNNELYLADSVNYRIRKVSLDSGIISSIVGTNSYVYYNSETLANQTNINVLNAIVHNDDIVMAESCFIRKTHISGKEKVIKIVGSGCSSQPIDNIRAVDTKLNQPKSIAYLPSGELIIADTSNHVIRKVDSSGNITLIAGNYNAGFSGDSLNAKSIMLNKPKGLVSLQDGRILFADRENNRIRQLTPYCADTDFSLVSGAYCVKNMGTIQGVPKFIVLKDTISFNIIVSKIYTNQSVIDKMLNAKAFSLTSVISLSSKNSISSTIRDFTVKNPQKGVLELFPIISMPYQFGNDNSIFSASVKIKVMADSETIVSEFSILFLQPPISPNSNILTLSKNDGQALTTSFTANITNWRVVADLSLKYAIAIESPALKEAVRITEFSESLTHIFALPYLKEDIKVKVLAMDILGNMYSTLSEKTITLQPFAGTSQEYSDFVKTATSFNLLTVLIYDKTNLQFTNEYYNSLLQNINVKESDTTQILKNIQQITSKVDSYDKTVANNTISKLSELVQYAITSYNTSKELFGYVKDKITNDNIQTVLQLASDTFSTGLDIQYSRELTKDLATLLITSQIATPVQNSSLSLLSFSSSNINITVSSFIINSNQIDKQQVDQDLISLSFNASQILAQYSGFSSECAVSLLSFSNLFNNSQQENDSLIISNEPISVTTDFKFMKNNKVLNLENLEQSIEIIFKLQYLENDRILNLVNNQNDTSSVYNLSCTFLNENTGKWSKEGCWLSKYDSMTRSIHCECNHTTLFSTFLEQKTLQYSKPVIAQISAMYYAQIAFGVFYLIVSVIVLVLLIGFRNYQPIASRLATPYLGIVALIFETGLIYIVQRSVLVSQFNKPSTDWTSGDLASNWIANIVMIIVNTLQLTAIFSYVLQVLRFQLMKYVYNILMEIRKNKKNLDNFNLIIRKLTSKRLFITALIVFAITNVIYWTLWVILVRTSVIEQKVYTYIISITYITVILSLGLIVACVSIIDWIYSSISVNRNIPHEREQSNTTSSEGMKKPLDIIETAKNQILSQGFVTKLISLDRPLYFRMEMVLFCLSFVMLILNQSLGMSTLDSRFDNELGYLKIQTNDIVSFIFEVIYMALHLLVYGGFCLIVIIFNKIQSKRRDQYQEDDVENKEMTDLLENVYGFSIFEDFCNKEFSSENLYLYQDLLSLEKHNNEQLSQIYEKYIEHGAEMEVNIPSDCYKKYANYIKSSKQGNEMKEKNSMQNLSEIDEIIMLLKDNVVINLSDTFSRFVLSKEYEIYASLLQIQQDVSNNRKL